MIKWLFVQRGLQRASSRLLSSRTEAAAAESPSFSREVPPAQQSPGADKQRPRVAYDEFPISYPDFLPSPVENRRNALFTELVHADMLERRLVLDIPEFYVGSVLAITMSDPNLGDRKNRFVGICINRLREGLQHQVTLRNVIDGLGVEVMYEIYTPTILKLEVLKLERRLDDDLFYLVDALPEYSTFDFNMEPVPHPSGQPVPVNPLKVKLRSPPWTRRWDLYDFKGIEDSWTKQTGWFKRKLVQKTKTNYTMKYDVVQHYRDACQQLEYDLETQARMLQFESKRAVKVGSPDGGGATKRRILRSAANAAK